MKLTRFMSSSKQKIITTTWRGLNLLPSAGEGEYSSCVGVTTTFAPKLLIADGYTADGTVFSSPQAIYSSSAGLVLVAGGKLYLDGVEKLSGLSAGRKSIIEFHGKICVFPDKKYITASGGSGNIGNGSVYPAAGSCPDIDCACVHDNRVWGAKGSSIYACALGDVSDWTTFVDEYGNPDEGGAYAVDVASAGDFVCCYPHLGHVIFFKANAMHEMYGTTPSKFQLVEPVNTGCISSYGAGAIYSSLYYIAHEGIMRYAGSTPALVSAAISPFPLGGEEGCACVDKRNYYAHVGGKVYVYDMYTNLWSVLLEGDVAAMAYHEGELCVLMASGQLRRYSESGSVFEDWHVETPDIYAARDIEGGFMSLKTVNKLDIRAELNENSTLKILISVDGGEFIEHLTIERDYSDRTVYSKRIHIPKCTFFKMRLEGKGKAIIHELNRTVLYGRDL